MGRDRDMKHETMTLPLGKDAGFEVSIDMMRAKLLDLGIAVEERAWLHPGRSVVREPASFGLPEPVPTEKGAPKGRPLPARTESFLSV